MGFVITKAERRTTKSAVREKRKARRYAPVPCVLCGAHITAGHMLEHKQLAHGERPVTPSPATPRRDTWVSVHQGGLPGLGKRAR